MIGVFWYQARLKDSRIGKIVSYTYTDAIKKSGKDWIYRVSEGKVDFLIGLWEKEIYKLDYIWR